MFRAAPFRIHYPTVDLCPIVASIPHSGLIVPEEIVAALKPNYRDFLPHQDWHLNKLYGDLPQLGITVLEATYSRYVVDLNRAAKAPFIGSFWQAVVTKQTAYGKLLYCEALSQQHVQARIDQVYRPYHRQLSQLLKQMVDQFGYAYLLDLHSFAGPIVDQVCLGNSNGRTCSEEFISAVDRAFVSQDYQVARNHVFNGGYITRHYGTMPNVQSLQIELRYHNYLNLNQLKQERIPDWDIPEFRQAKRKIQSVLNYLVQDLKPNHKTDD